MLFLVFSKSTPPPPPCGSATCRPRALEIYPWWQWPQILSKVSGLNPADLPRDSWPPPPSAGISCHSCVVRRLDPLQWGAVLSASFPTGRAGGAERRSPCKKAGPPQLPPPFLFCSFPLFPSNPQRRGTRSPLPEQDAPSGPFAAAGASRDSDDSCDSSDSVNTALFCSVCNCLQFPQECGQIKFGPAQWKIPLTAHQPTNDITTFR